MVIADVQIVRKLVLGAGVAVGVLMYAVTASVFESGMIAHEMVEWAGIVAIVICILGRTWASLYIGGRKGEQLITDGPYSVTRNPLYFFSIFGAAGAGAQLGSVIVGLIFGVLAWVVLYVVIFQEEQLLAEYHGAPFATYKRKVPRLLPNPWLWRDAPEVTVIPQKALRTFADAMIFLLAVPVAEMFEKLQNLGMLPVLFRLP